MDADAACCFAALAREKPKWINMMPGIQSRYPSMGDVSASNIWPAI
jgi:hypothetical protein